MSALPRFRLDPTLLSFDDIEAAIVAATHEARLRGCCIRIDTNEPIATVWPDGKVDCTSAGSLLVSP
jgi:hypothetical protein